MIQIYLLKVSIDDKRFWFCFRNVKTLFISGGVLTFNNMQKYHAGFVQCFACNVLGCTYWAAMIQVNPKQIKQQTSQQHYYEGVFLIIVLSNIFYFSAL